jgi:SAM-dependent methyltransferase
VNNTIKAKTSKKTVMTLKSIIEDYTSEGSIILDIPCGKGALAQQIMKSPKKYRVYGGDILNLCNVENINFNIVDMNQPLPYSSNFFDAVICGDGIAHLTRPFDFVKECNRILKPTGLLLISTPNLSSLRSRLRYFLTGFHNKRKTPLNEEVSDPEHIINALDFPDIRYLLYSNGFSIESIYTNRYKIANLAYAVFLPLILFFTLFSFVKELCQRNRTRHDFYLYKEVFKNMFRMEVLFGETLILKLTKKDNI